MDLQPLSALIVEDSEDDLLLLLRALRSSYDVRYERTETAATMREALARGQWDIVISDDSLPNFSGKGALAVLQESGRDIPFIVVSGAIHERDVVGTLKAGAHDFIPKGDFSRLVPAIAREIGEAADRHQRRQAQEELYASQRLISSTLDSIATQIAILNQTGAILYTNRAWQEFGEKNYPRNNLRSVGANYLELCSCTGNGEDSRWVKKVIKGIQSVIDGDDEIFSLECPLYPLKQDRWLKLQVTRFIGEGPVQVVVALEEITERRRMQERLEYLGNHDSLTGLYNRDYFDRIFHEISRENYTPVGIIVCDINGLKLVNNTLGDEIGDVLLLLATDFMRKAAPPEAIAARTDGDEFTILLPNTSPVTVKSVYEEILQSVASYNSSQTDSTKGMSLSLSAGYAIGGGSYKELQKCFKEAGNNMYREKLHSGQSARSAIVNTVMKLLEARDFLTEGHADRLQNIVAGLGKVIGLSESQVADLRLLAQFHDIGKVGIPDRILFKPGPLTPEEYAIMKRHCDIGFRIAQEIPDMTPIAEQILKHHEWWNGEGYPLGLQGESIPLECRILTIADAYDAMISDRPYRKAMSHEQAIDELKRFSGIQFDARLVKIFIKIITPQGETSQ